LASIFTPDLMCVRAASTVSSSCLTTRYSAIKTFKELAIEFVKLLVIVCRKQAAYLHCSVFATLQQFETAHTTYNIIITLTIESW